MVCPNCGKRLPKGERFCRFCGCALNGARARDASEIDSGAEIGHNSVALYNRGVAYTDVGDFGRAIADYTAALKINPDYSAALSNRGAAYNSLGKFDLAIADCTAVLKMEPDNVIALSNRGIAYAQKGDFGRAIADCTAALAINPNHSLLLFNRGIAYSRLGEYDRAIADCEAALRINPKDRRLKDALEFVRHEKSVKLPGRGAGPACSDCGTPLLPGAKVCDACGGALVRDSSQKS